MKNIIKQSFIKIIVFLLLLLPFSLMAQDTEWTKYCEKEGVNVFYRLSDCNIPEEGIYRQYYMLKFENTNSYKVKVQWNIELWYNNKCETCNDPENIEYKSQLDIPASSTIQGECSTKFKKELKVFSKLLKFPGSKVLTRFELNKISVLKAEL
ncbi:MAG: hypothetical protein V2A54_06185 [Bacteroidota bacterium]